MTTKSKKDARVISKVKSALDSALSDGLINQDAYDRINIPGLRLKKEAIDWEFEEVPPPPPEPETIPEPDREDICLSLKETSKKSLARPNPRVSMVKGNSERTLPKRRYYTILRIAELGIRAA